MDELNNSQILKFLIKNYEFLLGPEVFLGFALFLAPRIGALFIFERCGTAVRPCA